MTIDSMLIASAHISIREDLVQRVVAAKRFEEGQQRLLWSLAAPSNLRFVARLIAPTYAEMGTLSIRWWGGW